MKIHIRQDHKPNRQNHDQHHDIKATYSQCRINSSDQVKSKSCIGPLFNFRKTRNHQCNTAQQFEDTNKGNEIEWVAQLSEESYSFRCAPHIWYRGGSHEQYEEYCGHSIDYFCFFHYNVNCEL